ncbi:hypothetical protein B0T20DRAFT_105903 [Sordaria brevicollis]|nr:hypothetical protein B0T20DRAFT_105903 [Sordaria brevicollis]
MSTRELQYYVNSVSKGLAEVTTSSTVQFIHESVGDFLRGSSDKSDPSARMEGFRFDNMGEIHESLKQVCLDYILAVYSEIFSDDYSKDLGLSADQRSVIKDSKYPFLHYAVINVLHHSEQAYCRGIPQSAFLHDFPVREWARLYNGMGDVVKATEIRRYGWVKFVEFETPPSILYLLAQFNAHNLLRDHPDIHQQFKVRCGGLGYPWMAAVRYGNIESLQHLVNAAETSPSSHLTPQKVNSFPEGMYHIIASAWEVDRWSEFSKTDHGLAACLAAFGHGPLLETFLLQVGSRHCRCQASLQSDKTLSYPCPTMVQSIVNHRHQGGENTIFWARTAEALEVLLTYGADPNIADDWNQTAAYRAVCADEEETDMEQLKAICSVQDLKVKLKFPSSRCSIEPTMENGGRIQDASGVLDPPLAPRFDINVRLGPRHETVLINLISDGETDCATDFVRVRHLLDSFPDVDIHIRDDFGRFALLYTVYRHEVNIDTFKLLLDRYTDSDLRHLNTPDKDGRTIVSHAAKAVREDDFEGRFNYLEALFERFPGIALDTPDNKGWTPLRWAVDFDERCLADMWMNEDSPWDNYDSILLLLKSNKVNPFHGLEGGTSAFTEMKRAFTIVKSDVQGRLDEGYEVDWTPFEFDTMIFFRQMIRVGRDKEIMAQFQLSDEEMSRIQKEVAEAQKMVEDVNVMIANFVETEDESNEED